MTATAAKTKIVPTWDAKKTAQATARVVAGNVLATKALLQKVSPELREEYEDQVRAYRVETLKTYGVKTPLDYVTASAELDANMYGSQAEVCGDANSAQLVYEQCGMWNAMLEVGKLTPEQQKQMGEGFQACASKTADAFGFKAKVEFSENSAVLTVTK